VDLAHPQGPTNGGQSHTEIYTSLEIGQDLIAEHWRLFADPNGIAVFGKLDRNKRGIPALQYSGPEDQFMGSSNGSTRRRFGVDGGIVVMVSNSYLLHTHFDLQAPAKTPISTVGRRLNQGQLPEAPFGNAWQLYRKRELSRELSRKPKGSINSVGDDSWRLPCNLPRGQVAIQ